MKMVGMILIPASAVVSDISVREKGSISPDAVLRPISSILTYKVLQPKESRRLHSEVEGLKLVSHQKKAGASGRFGSGVQTARVKEIMARYSIFMWPRSENCAFKSLRIRKWLWY